MVQTTLYISGLELFGTTTSICSWDDRIDALKRAVGCAVMMMLPSKGLDEALSGLRDAWEFHYHGPYEPISPEIVYGRVTLDTEEASKSVRPAR